MNASDIAAQEFPVVRKGYDAGDKGRRGIDSLTQAFSALITLIFPVSVQKKSPRGAALAIGITWRPSMTASSDLKGSTSQTITCAPCPFARFATPLPHQP